jgi:hypothetical protein
MRTRDKETTMTRATYETEYGTIEVNEYRREGQRLDTYTSKIDGQKSRDLIFCAGPQDISNQHNSGMGYGGEYNPKCSCCWLGFGHSEEAHVAKAK